MSARVYLYPRWLRLWHWSNAVLFLVLIATGLNLRFADPDSEGLGFAASRAVHNASGILLVLSYLGFLLGNVFTRNGRYYRPEREDWWRGPRRQLRYYLWGIFRGEPQPYPHGERRKFNPLQKLSYLAVMFLLMPLMIATGVVMLFPDKIPEELWGRSGMLVFAFSHTLLGYVLIAFMLVHVYLGTTGHTALELIHGMTRGWLPVQPDGPTPASEAPARAEDDAA